MGKYASGDRRMTSIDKKNAMSFKDSSLQKRPGSTGHQFLELSPWSY